MVRSLVRTRAARLRRSVCHTLRRHPDRSLFVAPGAGRPVPSGGGRDGPRTSVLSLGTGISGGLLRRGRPAANRRRVRRRGRKSAVGYGAGGPWLERPTFARPAGSSVDRSIHARRWRLRWPIRWSRQSLSAVSRTLAIAHANRRPRRSGAAVWPDRGSWQRAPASHVVVAL